MGAKSFASKYEGYCGLCRQPYQPGDKIAWLKSPVTGPKGGVYKMRHAECGEESATYNAIEAELRQIRWTLNEIKDALVNKEAASA